MKKVKSVELWFRGEMDHRYCRGEGAMVMEKGGEREREREEHRGEYTRRTFPIAIGLENERGCIF